MDFAPNFCPRPTCPSRSGRPFRFHRKGLYTRKCDRRIVQRFLCLVCRHRFSAQTFRGDYRFRRPELLPRLFIDLVSKVTHRQSARNHACSRTTIARHFERLARHCRDFHEARLAEVRVRGGLSGTFLLDELETYENCRKLQPVTMPVLIEKTSGFVLETRTAALPARGRLTPSEEEHLKRLELKRGRRRNGSRGAVKRCFQRLTEVMAPDVRAVVMTDEKTSYASVLRELFENRCVHVRIPSTLPRTKRNPLWPINHTLARLRDGVSRLVRETWAASKLRRRLEDHAGIWMAYRNYVRGMTNKRSRIPPAMALGVCARRWTFRQMVEWRVFVET